LAVICFTGASMCELSIMGAREISLGGNLLHRCKGDRRKGVGEFFKLFPLAEAGSLRGRSRARFFGAKWCA
jgi:hypothetical protein